MAHATMQQVFRSEANPFIGRWVAGHSTGADPAVAEHMKFTVFAGKVVGTTDIRINQFGRLQRFDLIIEGHFGLQVVTIVILPNAGFMGARLSFLKPNYANIPGTGTSEGASGM